jgi:hypothetical protein
MQYGQTQQSTTQQGSTTGQQVTETSTQSTTKVLRGSQLIGLHIWNSENQYLGVVKDFYLYNQESGCPAIYLAMSPATTTTTTATEGFVVVPFDIMQVQYDTNRRTNYFVLNMRSNELRNAPRIQGNKWDIIHNQNFLTTTQQFYRKVERTAARPIEGTRDGRNLRNENQYRRDTDTSKQPGTTPQEPRMKSDSSHRDQNAPMPPATPPSEKSDANRDTGSNPSADTTKEKTDTRTPPAPPSESNSEKQTPPTENPQPPTTK